MKNLLSMEHLTIEEINHILDRAQAFENGEASSLSRPYNVANLFFEPSTRTKTSFEMAERKVGCIVIPFDASFSSVTKGETLYDTVKTLEMIGMDAVVIRAKEDAYYNELLEGINVSIINGGDGTGQHPSQSLLDLYTIRKEFGSFEGLNVTIAGDISHSRVAKSNALALQRLGANVHFLCPEDWAGSFEAHHSWDDLIEISDVIMLLRVQHERHKVNKSFSKESYHNEYGLTIEREKQMKEKAIIMHPAPVNRDVEIASELVECERSRIFEQVRNGVYTRMAIVETILKGRE
ncbi:aspartate carbamoyltransferase catalytic subunit [Lysinibacillus xylanilyticus]|uniref:Aspartate carbamoyltransferase n=1 Tax=Lysinibacillus xylanilyticus TaxID=582475 RepID=A0ABT4ERE9_9BACI|nr:aspartate carbamoyltransferase catalytic subunit [Lysinibacillus xylanilyticus]MCY9548245.1 aspartate carbamoyltransferase catalytic subunit [Lysinibacillus xylanilyticus]MED3801964.1 aspartate carbamoyltransferase catalytic subunit [Lysinibacillus xylanilyticus]